MTDDQLRNRLKELSRRSYEKGIYTYSGFLSLAELSELYAMRDTEAPYTVSGGMEGCERKLVRFGSPELTGYDEELPIVCLTGEPKQARFSEALTHRDWLGSLMGLGITRSAVGDIIIKENKAYIFCLENMADFIIENLTQVKRTAVRLNVSDHLPEGELYALKETVFQVASERIDAIISHAWHLSRSEAIKLISDERVFINSRLVSSPAKTPAAGDIISVRGTGRLRYMGAEGTTKKGKLNVRAAIFVT